mmetsp:Transcript_11590/g.16915  ORF Transcript_11590/g.16915 Transcript_11590/m.16915 type:complete len:347 (-) Transcript_11590:88-1128(-)|eukprot:CAMPEP_0194072576 /NCGR_PEP_ID=MMETSP0149-20130528/287_1 /TAXON_ID=122233 /ORGANISM="Chaetoceros debilis, Strain MM31A-1" /LENGTH=346 /DNA_ID=CAMNT_0038752473 /DNA_START=117 /DNA_END=1157 /DNA_ORIENTATION=+
MSLMKEVDFENDKEDTRIGGKSSSREILFQNKCKDYLFNNDTISDGIISQIEYANFLVSYSIHESRVCSGSPQDVCTNKSFESIDLQLQLSFIWALCPNESTAEENKKCFSDLYGQGKEFGWVTGIDGNHTNIAGKVENYCNELWTLATDFHGGPNLTIAPSSSSPSVSPTENTISPTESTAPYSKNRDEIQDDSIDQIKLDEGGAWDPVRLAGVSILVGLVIMAAVFTKAIRHLRRRKADSNVEEDAVDLSTGDGVDRLLQLDTQQHIPSPFNLEEAERISNAADPLGPPTPSLEAIFGSPFDREEDDSNKGASIESLSIVLSLPSSPESVLSTKPSDLNPGTEY